MLWPKKNSYKEFDEKFLRLENVPPLPPTTFLMVRPLQPLPRRKKRPGNEVGIIY